MRYHVFGKSGLRVSEICLGTMTFGTEWGWGADYETSAHIFDQYANAGGNFIDTANRYTEGTSERMVGDFIRADRDHFVLATKYTLKDRSGDPNFAGNHRKNLLRSVRESLARLKTDYLDILWVHAWDFTTPAQEVLRALDDLITRGLVHAIGVSDTPAWIVAHGNTLAELRGWNAFCGLQIEYNLLQRTGERELLPMARQFGLALTPWAPLAGGALTGKYLAGEKGRVAETSARRGENAVRITRAVLDVAAECGHSAAQVAINWTRQKHDPSIPIVGARDPRQLQDSLGCLDFVLNDAQMARLDDASRIELGFPHDFLASDGVRDVVYAGSYGQILPGPRR